MPQPTHQILVAAARPPFHRVSGTIRRALLLNNQATDRLGDDLLKLAWPFGLGSCPKVDHDADDADRVPEGAQRIWSRAHGASIPNDPRPTFQILVMRNVSRRGYRGAPGVKE